MNTRSERHNYLAAGETFHDILRMIYNMARAEHRGIFADICLALSPRVINCKVGPHGLYLQILVFGVLTKVPQISPKDFPTKRERM